MCEVIYGVRCDRAEDEPLRRTTQEAARASADMYDLHDTCGPHVVVESRDGGRTWAPLFPDTEGGGDG